MQNVILIIALAAIVGAAIRYIYKAKKGGAHCIGCPDSASCPHCNSGGCSCGTGQQGTACSGCAEKK